MDGSNKEHALLTNEEKRIGQGQQLFFEKLCLKARFDVNTHCCIFGFDHQYFVFYVRSTIEKIIGCT
ncbi:MAG TPA: hypothetical protein PLC89_27155 [Haliscomenobacter sp.]|uniref:hypothetical protein n=1 Tax=Haliscomenobacter sp. TaxID=2717303 RepID=UPI002CDC3A22|nr:hypothetical protein [Haliscomenobacter sp.]HOY21020.1 hypothetical protein [Haliscomenobacter sp.]